MRPEDFQALADRASRLDARRDQRLDEVHARIARAARSRQVVAVTASVVTVVLVLGAITGAVALLNPDRVPPATPPLPTSTPTVEAPAVRKLAWATGHTIHWGDRRIDGGGRVRNVTPTDDGVVFTREGRGEESGNCNVRPGCFGTLWFADASGIARIGRAYGTLVRGYQVQLSTAGSTVVWLEPALDDRPGRPTYPGRGEYVAYDSGTRREVARFGSPSSTVRAVYDDRVYWTPDEKTSCLDHSRYHRLCRRFRTIMRLDTSTGVQTRVAWAAYVHDRSSRPRTFSRPIRGEADTPGPVLSDTIAFGRQGDRLLADDGGGGVVTASLARTGEPVRLRPPSGHPAVDAFVAVAWLDEHRVVLQMGDDGLAVCRLPDGRCRTVVTGAVVADFAARG